MRSLSFLLGSHLLAVVGCSREPAAENPARAPVSAGAPVLSATASSAAPATSAPASPAASSANAAASPSAAATAGFVAFMDDKPWSASAVPYSATLMDAIAAQTFRPAPGVAASPPTSPRPREIQIDVRRKDDGERIAITLQMTKDIIGKHPYVCHGDDCRPAFQAQLYREKPHRLFWVKEPSTVEVTKLDPIDDKRWRLSLWLDLTFRDASGAQKKAVHAVGVLENLVVDDIGEPVGLMKSGDAELVVLPVDRLPAPLRAGLKVP